MEYSPLGVYITYKILDFPGSDSGWKFFRWEQH